MATNLRERVADWLIDRMLRWDGYPRQYLIDLTPKTKRALLVGVVARHLKVGE